MYLFRVIFLLIALFRVNLLFSQQELSTVHFQAISINNGISQGFVSSIIQDKQGFIWFTTADGLNKFDGYDFTVYHHNIDDPNSIGSDDLTYVFEDSKGRLWIGTRNDGINYFDRQQNKFYHIRSSATNNLISNRINIISEDKDGALWITTEEGVVRMEMTINPNKSITHGFFETHTFRFVPVKANHLVTDRKNGIIKGSIFTDSKGERFYVNNNEIFEVTSASGDVFSFKKVASFPVGKNDFIAGIMEDVTKGEFLINADQIFRFSKRLLWKRELLYQYRPIRAGHVWTMDNRGGLWVNEGSGILHLDLRTGQSNYILPTDTSQYELMRTTTCMVVDRNGVLWLGTGGYGILKYDPEMEHFHRILPGTKQYQLSEVSPNIVMTNNFELIELVKQRNPKYIDNVFLTKLRRDFKGHNILRFASDGNGCVWIPDGKDLLRVDLRKKKRESFTVIPSKEKNMVEAVFDDREASLWYFTGKDLSNFFYPYNVDSNNIRILAEPNITESIEVIMPDGDFVWIGTNVGLLKFDMPNKKVISRYIYDAANKQSISNNFIYSLCKDLSNPSKYLWIGTKGGGINRLDKTTGKFVRYGTKQGLSNNVVYGILAGDDGNLWLSTNKGLSAFDPETKLFRNYDEQDGLQSNEFNRYSFCKTIDGLLVFGGMNGINYFDPNELQPLPAPKVIFTELRLFNEKVDVRTANSPLKTSINYASHIVLKYEQNMVTFQFSGMDFRRQGNLYYRYKMKGFDKGWVYSGAIREATYTNLSPGNYSFVVQASFDNFTWNNEESMLQVTVLTPWFKSWWFYSSVTALVVAFLYILYRFRLRQLRRIDLLRDRIARDLHDDVGSSISTISIYSRIMQEQSDKYQIDSRFLIDKINVFANEISESMSDIVWTINRSNDGFERILAKMREYAYQLLEPRGYHVIFEIDNDLLLMTLSMERRRDFYLIFKEALNNILKYAKGTNVYITLGFQQQSAFMSIKDDGAGFLKSEISMGNGIKNMEYRASLLKGQLKVISFPGDGTEIELTFPLS